MSESEAKQVETASEKKAEQTLQASFTKIVEVFEEIAQARATLAAIDEMTEECCICESMSNDELYIRIDQLHATIRAIVRLTYDE